MRKLWLIAGLAWFAAGMAIAYRGSSWWLLAGVVSSVCLARGLRKLLFDR